MGLLPDNDQRLIIRERTEDDQRRYNAPTTTEIAVMIPDSEFTQHMLLLLRFVMEMRGN